MIKNIKEHIYYVKGMHCASCTLGIGLLIIIGFIGLNKLGLSGLINVGSKSSLPMFFVFGIIAGISSCAALVGGIILSISKQWGELYLDDDSFWKKIQPHLIFNTGRIISYGVLGTALGAIGSKLNFSLKFGPILVIAVSIMMIFLAFQMFGFKAFRKFQFTMPKFITRFIASESNFKGRYMPFLMGAFTFFLPCGFTITAQGLALISGSATQGGLIMFLFALGTLPSLLAIGLSSVKFSQKPHLSNRFLKISGILVLFFALYNINFQLNVLGISSLSDLGINSIQPSNTEKSNSLQNEEGLPSIVQGKQILKMDASSRGYSPSYLKVKVGIPVRWEITDTGTSGCTNAVISKNLFEGEIPLTPGQTSIKEFTPEKPGKYKFSCWMGMISGIIEVIDKNGAASQNNILNKI
jgi:sulfite exporter TauE/SafE